MCSQSLLSDNRTSAFTSQGLREPRFFECKGKLCASLTALDSCPSFPPDTSREPQPLQPLGEIFLNLSCCFATCLLTEQCLPGMGVSYILPS